MFIVYSEDVRTQHESTLKAHYSECVRHLSVRDVATLRGRMRPPPRSTVEKDSDEYLLRYGSIQSLPTTATQYSAFLPSYNVNSLLKPHSRTAAEAIYATPMQLEPSLDINDVDIPPPLPPPPLLEFRSAACGSELVPIATKFHHTYANVSEAVQAKSAGAVESSFRPGENACLSSAVNSDSDRHDGRASAEELADSRNEDTVSGSIDAECRSTSSHHSTHSNASSSSSLSSHSSLPLLRRFLTSVSSPSSSSASLLPPPPPPPLLSSVDGIGLNRNMPLLPRRGVKQAGGIRMCSQNGSKNSGIKSNGSSVNSLSEAIPLCRNLVNRADMEVTDDRMQYRMLHKADHTAHGVHTMVAPLKVIREQPQVARITKRSFSVDAAAQENLAADSDRTASMSVDSEAREDADCSFLLLAELARQEYIKRRASVTGCCEEKSRTSTNEEHKLTTQPSAAVDRHNPPLNGGEFKRMTAPKAVELQRNKVAATNDGLVVSNCYKGAVAATNGCHRTLANSTLNEQYLFPQFTDSKVNQNEYSSETLKKLYDREHAAVPTSDILSGRTSFSSEYKVSELEPCCDELVLLPPPPDFEEDNGENLSTTELITSTALPSCEASIDHLLLDMVLPPPPPEFSDSPNLVRRDFGCRPVATWSVSDVTEWLDSLQMSNHRDMFMAHSVDGPRLMGLGRSELIALGVSQVGQRMNLERAIKRAVISVPSCL